MKDVEDAIRSMSYNLTAWAERSGRALHDVEYIRKLGESVVRKVHFVDLHYQVLAEYKWHNLPVIQNSPMNTAGIDASERMGLDGEEMFAAEILVLNAVTGAISSCVNAVDTLALLLNLVYQFGIHSNRANMPHVAEKVPADSPLGSVVLVDPGSEWMRPLRGLRGKCQHDDITHILTNAWVGVGVALEPSVNHQYLINGSEELRVSEYVNVAKQRTFEFIAGMANVISSDPEKAVKAV